MQYAHQQEIVCWEAHRCVPSSHHQMTAAPAIDLNLQVCKIGKQCWEFSGHSLNLNLSNIMAVLCQIPNTFRKIHRSGFAGNIFASMRVPSQRRAGSAMHILGLFIQPFQSGNLGLPPGQDLLEGSLDNRDLLCYHWSYFDLWRLRLLALLVSCCFLLLSSLFSRSPSLFLCNLQPREIQAIFG